MIEMQATPEQWLGAVATALVQGMALTALVALLLRTATGMNAATRHAILFVTLGMVGLLFVVHLPRKERPAEPKLLLSEVAVPDTATEEPAVTFDATEELEAGFADFIAAPIQFDLSPVAAIPEEKAVAASPTPSPAPTWTMPSPGRFAQGLGILWVILAAGRLLRVGWECWLLRKAKAAAELPPQEIEELFQGVREEVSTSRDVRILVSPEISAPLAAGFAHPAALLPSSLVENATTQQLAQILRHEVAHLARRDDWANLIQQSVHALLFFHPAVWWLSRRLTIEREIACDDAALHRLNSTRERRAYALFLTEFASQSKGRGLLAAPAGWRQTTQLKERITMILDKTRNASPKVAPYKATMIGTVAALAALLGFMHGPRLAFAGETEPTTETVPAAVAVDVDASVAAEVTEPKVKAVIVTSADGGAAVFSAARTTEPTPSATLHATPPPHAPPAPGRPPHARADRPHPDARPAHPAVRPVHPDARPMHPDARPGDHSIEQRLARLEHMVHSLMAELGKHQPKPPAAFSFRGPDGSGSGSGAGWGAGGGAWAGPSPDKIEEQVRREMERAGREIERAHRDIDRARKEAQKGELGRDRAGRAGLAAERQELQARRKAIEQELRQIERQEIRLREQEEGADKESRQTPKEKAPEGEGKPQKF